MAELQLISSDSHVSEPPDLWVERIDTKYRDRAPRVVLNPEGQEGAYFVYEGYPPHNLAIGLGAGRTPEELAAFLKTGTYADARPGGWDPAQRLPDMELDGVEAEVLYTTLGFRLFWLKDAALQRACFRVYNDWLAAYCSYAPKRLKGLALISLYDPKEGAQELERCAKLGLKGAMIWCSPPADQPYSSEIYDPFWAAAQDLDMPVSLHAITGMERIPWEYSAEKRAMRSTVTPHEIEKSFSVLILSGVLERFPRLKIVSAENNCGWLPYYLQRMDRGFARFGPSGTVTPWPTKLTLKPSEYFRRQMYCTFIDDSFGVASRHWIGVDNVMWSSDYPHTASTWPHSRDIIERDFKDVSEVEKRKIVRENVAKLYGFDLG
jgi:predicted TIM-barrel fold metal-dependent hydrolase